MFCDNVRALINCDHFVIKIISNNIIDIKNNKDREIVKAGEAKIIYGGFSPGKYIFTNYGYTNIFIYKNKITIKKIIVENNKKIEILIDRNKWGIEGI